MTTVRIEEIFSYDFWYEELVDSFQMTLYDSGRYDCFGHTLLDELGFM